MSIFGWNFCHIGLAANGLVQKQKHSRSQQRPDQRVLVHTLKFLALKKLVSQKFLTFFLSLFYAIRQFGRYNIFKKKLGSIFYRGKTVFLGLKISMYVLRPSDQSSVCSYCGLDFSQLFLPK